MERSEPALVPEWLRNAGSVTGGGSSTHHSASSSSSSDVPSSPHQARSRSSRSRSDVNSPRSTFLDRSSSSSSWRSSSNGSAKHAYSSFTRNRDRDKDRLNHMDPWNHDSSDPLGSILTSREKDGLRRSCSMVSRKQGEILPFRDLKNRGDDECIGNGKLFGPSGIIGSGIHKAVFDKDFPSLGNEYRQRVTDVSRVSSPVLIPAAQSLPVSNSALIGGEGWTSALAEVPNVMGSGNMGSLASSQTSGRARNGIGAPAAISGLNMAEALAQAPSRDHTPPQEIVKTQRLEELAIKQSRQLIPVIPPMPKGSVLSSSDKSKSKTVARTSEMSLSTPRSGLQQPSTFTHAIQPLPGGQTKPDSTKNSQGGKLLILKPSWENGVAPSPKEVASPTNNANVRAPSNNQLTSNSSASAPPTRTLNSPRDAKALSLNLMPGLTQEKRPSLSQTKSRNDFFKLLKQKSSANMSTDSFYAEEKPEVPKEVMRAPESPHSIVNGSEVTNDDDDGASEVVQRLSHVEEKYLSSEAAGYPDEEELAFLRALGWEEPHGEDEGLTEEEIDSFIKEFKKSKPSLKVCRAFDPELP